jgi:putative acetyltransferase
MLGSSPRFSVAGTFCFLAICVVTTCIIACNSRQASQAVPANHSVSSPSAYPLAVDLNRVGKYPSATKSGAGYFYDDVLEYRVWFHPAGGGDDRYAAFAQYEPALAFSKATPDAEEPLVLVRQSQWIDEPDPGHYVPKSGERITEWQVRWLSGNKRTADSIAEFMKHARPARN